jgi:hypothetical protein
VSYLLVDEGRNPLVPDTTDGTRHAVLVLCLKSVCWRSFADTVGSTRGAAYYDRLPTLTSDLPAHVRPASDASVFPGKGCFEPGRSARQAGA